MNANQMNTGRGYWLAWFLASIVGFGFGAILATGVSEAITFGIVLGATGGFMQWLVLRERVARSGWWVLASTLGFAAGTGAIGTAGLSENYAMAGILMVAVFGVVGGILQWLTLRRQVARAGWWVLANILGSLVGLIGVPAAVAIISANGNFDQSALVFGLLFGAGYGAITGAALVWLLRQSHPSNVEGLATGST